MRKRRHKANKALLFLAGCILLTGCSLLLYSPVAQWLENRKQSEIYTEYTSDLDDLDENDIEDEIQKAREHNEDLKDIVDVTDPFDEELPLNESEYNSLLHVNTDGVMGYIEIPKINVLLPIYHGVSSEVLAKGIGHLPETSLPVGGSGTHCVLAGHSGMSHARLFTDLNKLEMGDVFYIQVYNRVYQYQVDQIKTVTPSDTRDLKIVEGKDYVTLVTCTPRGVNSHRLLVRGTRVLTDQTITE